VGIKFQKKFELKKRIHSKVLIKQLVSGTFEVIVPLFFIPLLWAIGIIITIGLIKIGISYSPNLTFILIMIIGLIWYYKRKKRKEEMLRRFHK